MSKRYKGKTCAYCGKSGASETEDHVLAGHLVAARFRHEIPKVPACQSCNNEKSKLEHYAATVLPFGGRDEHSGERLANDVGPRLSRNKKLFRQIAAGQRRVWVKQNGLFIRSMGIPIDGRSINALVCYIVRGLMFHHWGLALDQASRVEATALTVYGEDCLHRFFALYAEMRAEGDIGQGALVYRAVQANDDPRLSAWEVSIYGGTVMSGGDQQFMTTRFGVLTTLHGVESRIAHPFTGTMIIRH